MEKLIINNSINMLTKLKLLQNNILNFGLPISLGSDGKHLSYGEMMANSINDDEKFE